MDRRMTAKALFLGLLTDLLGTFIGGVIASLAAAVVLALIGVRQALEDQALLTSTTTIVIEMAFGTSFTGLGGYVTAAIAPTEKLRHALGMGFLSLLTSLALLAFSGRQGPAWYYAVSCLLALPAALLGGYLGAMSGKPKSLFERVLLASSVLTFLYTIALGCLTVLAIRG